MKFVTRLAVAAVCAAFAMAPAANASGVINCIQLGKKASEALTAAQPGQATDAARTEAAAARAYCASSMYAQGAARYTKALQLLGKS
jgi:hypothetical protein